MSTRKILFLLFIMAGLLLKVPASWGFSMSAPVADISVQNGSTVNVKVDPGNTSIMTY